MICSVTMVPPRVVISEHFTTRPITISTSTTICLNSGSGRLLSTVSTLRANFSSSGVIYNEVRGVAEGEGHEAIHIPSMHTSLLVHAQWAHLLTWAPPYMGTHLLIWAPPYMGTHLLTWAYTHLLTWAPPYMGTQGDG